MKDFKHFGVKRRFFPENNYNAFWFNLKTTRFGEGVAKELSADKAEFYDVSLGTKCNAGCDFCYVSAAENGECYEDICQTWVKWMSLYNESKDKNTGVITTDKPFQIAIGSQGEPTLVPEFCDFLETVYNTNVVPNYTTNGIILSYWDKKGSRYYLLANKILDYTKRYCGGVAVSFGNKSLRKFAKDADNGLIEKGDVNINLHHIISTKESVALDAANYIIDMIYTKTIREDEGGTYGVGTSMVGQRSPVQRMIAQIYFNTNPEAVEKLGNLAEKGLKELAANGPSQEQFNMAIENFKKNLPESRINNSYWMNCLQNWVQLGIVYDQEYEDALNTLTTEDVKAALQQLLSQDNVIKIASFPAE